MDNSETTITPIVGHNDSKVTNVGVRADHSTDTSYLYAGATKETGPSGSSTFFAGGSKDISNSSTISASASVNTKKDYSIGVSFERKF